MESMKRIAIVVSVVMAIMAAVGIYGLAPKVRPPETWLEEKMLTSVDDYQLIPQEFGSKVSYRMSQISYDTLKPIGIACQRLQDSRGEEVEVVVIAGDSMEAFHDQKICFNAQGWELKNQEVRYLETERHGRIPIMWMTINQPGQASKEAMYVFRTPLGFATYDSAKIEFLKAKLKDPFADVFGFSYRFIGLSHGVDEAELKRVAAAYLDQLDESTNGIL